MGLVWWRAMRCNTSHGVVDASESQAQHVRGMLWEMLGTFSRSGAVMWCFGMRHFAQWWMTIFNAEMSDKKKCRLCNTKRSAGFEKKRGTNILHR